MSNPQMTDERLRSWLDSNQLARERMCLAVLTLDKRFRHAKPRNPRGGRDGGRDIEAVYEDGRTVCIAVGFRNSASDSTSDRRAAQKKFKEDLERALQANSNLGIFVFFTNVSLTSGQRDALIKQAKTKGIDIVDILDRERIRIFLDGADGLAIRHQYLEMTMSDAEQAAFFGRWGNEITSLITNSMTAMESRFARLEFIQERNQPLTNFGFFFRFKEKVLRKDLGHFRAELTMHFMPPRKDGISLHMGFCDDRGDIHGKHPRRNDCMSSAGWTTGRSLAKPMRVFHTSQQALDEPISQLYVRHDDSFFRFPLLDLRLRDLEGNRFAFWVSERLSQLIDRIFIVANEYLIWSATRDELSMGKHIHKHKWPFTFDKEELKEPWVNVMSKRGAVGIDFSSVTPLRLYEAQAIEPPPKVMPRE